MYTDNQFQQWMLDRYDKSELRDIAHHGCVMGVHGMIYYSETTELYQQFKDAIWEILYDAADYFGLPILEFIAQGNGAKDVGGVVQFDNYLVWMATETVAWRIVNSDDFAESDDDDE